MMRYVLYVPFNEEFGAPYNLIEEFGAPYNLIEEFGVPYNLMRSLEHHIT